MRIYKDDGSWHTKNPTDVEFGWVWSAREFIYEQEPASVECSAGFNPEEINIFASIDKQIPRKSQVLSLINPCTIESKLLLSVVHYAMYKNFNPNMIKLEDLQNNLTFKYSKGAEQFLLDGILLYHHYRNQNMYSLYMELFLADNKFDINEVAVECTDSRSYCTKKTRFRRRRTRTRSQSAIYNQEEYNVIDERIETLFSEIDAIHDNIFMLNKFFQEEISRVDNLVKNAQVLEKDIRETKFLDDLIYFLSGKLEKIVLRQSAFRIFLRDKDEVNLII